MAQTKGELIKSVLRWTVQDIDYLHEATGLFADEQRSTTRFISLFSREQAELHTTAYGLQRSKQTFSSSLGNDQKTFDISVIEEIRELQAQLEQMTAEQLEARVEALRKQNLDKKEAERPFNNEESHLQNLWLWVRKSLWEPWEAILLLGDREPKVEVIEYLHDMKQMEIDQSPFATACYQALELMKTAISAGEISTPGTPLEYLRWFEKMKWDVPDSLRTGILEIHDPSQIKIQHTRRYDVEDSDLSVSEKESLLKLIAGMSIRGYSFDPAASRNQATSDIQSDLDHLGIGLDQKTILKWLREACQLVPSDNP